MVLNGLIVHPQGTFASTGGAFGPRGHLATSEDIFDYHNWEHSAGIQWAETRDTAYNAQNNPSPTQQLRIIWRLRNSFLNSSPSNMLQNVRIKDRRR